MLYHLTWFYFEKVFSYVQTNVCQQRTFAYEGTHTFAKLDASHSHTNTHILMTAAASQIIHIQ